MLANISFRLPDAATNVSLLASKDTGRKDGGLKYDVKVNDIHIAVWSSDPAVKTRVSPAQVLDERAEEDVIQRFELVKAGTEEASRNDSIFDGGVEVAHVNCVVNNNNHIAANGERESMSEYELAWISIYALWLSLQEQDVIAVAFPTGYRATQYVVKTGLGAFSPFQSITDDQQARVLLLSREAFWQGAGAPNRFDWLQARPESSFPGINGRLGAFASQASFTRKGNVCTTHPLRPPKPSPGTLLYSRFIAELGQHLKIVHIDASNPVHFDSYARWQNSDRVNHGWKERGPDSKHRAYLASQLADLHTMSCIFLWDDEPAGYCEVGWAKEDNTACFISSNCNIHVGEFDQNSHVLVGEERFRGGKRYQAVATSIKHLCFLRDPRTHQVIAEPRFDLPSVPIQARFLPQERKKIFQLPHKQAVLFALQRDRFFQEGHFY